MQLQVLKNESKAEKVKEQEEKFVEKSKAAAWAWYQHSNGGGGGGGGGGGAGQVIHRYNGDSAAGRRASRFKTEALKNGSYGRVDPRWDCNSSLFDSFELANVSKQIDQAFYENSRSFDTSNPLTIASKGGASPTGRKLVRTGSLRLAFPRYGFCRSISDVVSNEEASLGVRKCDCTCYRMRSRRQVGWTFRRIGNAINLLMHLPACEFHHHEHHHHHHHQHDHDHHHHHHYLIEEDEKEEKQFFC